MNVLYIDTTNTAEITIGLFLDESKYFLKEMLGSKRSQVVLPLIERILEEYQISLSMLDRIEVAIGPGSFTGVRVGVSIANALGFVLGIPVNGGYDPVEPVYL